MEGVAKMLMSCQMSRMPLGCASGHALMVPAERAMHKTGGFFVPTHLAMALPTRHQKTQQAKQGKVVWGVWSFLADAYQVLRVMDARGVCGLSWRWHGVSLRMTPS